MANALTVGGVILAAGRSSRMGLPKQLLELGGEPLVRHVVRTALASRLSEVIVVLGHEADNIAAQLGMLGQKIVINADYAMGQSTSMHAGMAALCPETDAVMFLLGDQPGVTSEVIDALIEAFERSQAPIVLPEYGGIRGNPVIFGRAMFDELRNISGDTGGRQIVRANPDRCLVIRVEAATPPPDVDTPEAYEAIRSTWEDGDSGS